MDTIGIFRDIATNPAQVATEWKESGRKVMGYRCLYVPEEFIQAAGMLAYPLYGTPEPVTQADAYFQSCTCEFTRNLFDLGLDGRLSFLDGLALSNTCDVVRRMADMWAGYIKDTPVYMVNNPQKLQTETNKTYFLAELARLRGWLEEISGNEITDDKLRQAIEMNNETRRLLRDLYALRREDPPAITGPEAFLVATAVTVMPKEKANPLLEKLLAELKDREVPDRDGPRIMVTGSVIDHPALIEMIEEEGGLVVADDLCNTTRYFWNLVDTKGDPTDALYRYLNERPLCACMHPTESRRDYVFALVDEFEVDAVVNFTLKYCHPFLYEAPLLKKQLEARDVPTTVLEVGHDMSGHGQLRTRIQAFIEMVDL